MLDHLIPLNVLYSESHNYKSVGKIWENYFSTFLCKINPIIKNKKILEIGCPSGKLALNSNEYQKWFIVEPNKNKTVVFNDKIHFIEHFFDDDFSIDEKVDIIIHSHLFEHIYTPNRFLQKCYEILTDEGEMIFGVPNMEHFKNTDIVPFLGVFFEHTIFLCKENIGYLLDMNHFEIIDIIDYENHSTIYHCKKRNEKLQTTKTYKDQNIQIPNYLDSFINSIQKYKNFIEHCNEIIEGCEKDVYLFGASYSTQFLLTLGMKRVKGILDNSKEKHNTYFYGFDLMIYPPDIILNNDCIVIIKNGYYSQEIYEQLKEINPAVTIII
jgi:predicted SAM-dependent methyltransferase